MRTRSASPSNSEGTAGRKPRPCLAKHVGEHLVVRAAYMGWGGLKNGQLLRVAEENGLEVLLTGDQTLHYEQELAGRGLAVVALSAIQLPIIRRSLPAIIASIDTATPGSFQLVDCGAFSRKSLPGDQ